MKQLTCEMCGSTDIVKQNGVFVCQTCGCKYSIEEARKMMVEGTVEVTGTVKIDQSGVFNNLLQAAKTAMFDGRFASAYSQSLEALAIKPDYPELVAIQGLADLGKEKIISDVPSSATNAMNRFFSGMNSWEADFSEKRTALSNVKRYLQVACKYQYELLDDEKSELNSQKVEYSEREERGAKWAQVGEALSGNVFTQAQAKSDLKDVQQRRQHNERIDAKIRKVSDRRSRVSSFESSNNKKLDSAISLVSRQEQEYLTKRKEEYWEAHKEEKETLEANIKTWKQRIGELTSSQDVIRGKINVINDELRSGSTPLQVKADELKNRIRELERQREGLGMFKGKEKKALTDTIASLRAQAPSMQDISKEKDEIKAKRAPEIEALNAEMKPLTTEITDLSKKVASAEAELHNPGSQKKEAATGVSTTDEFGWIKDENPGFVICPSCYKRFSADYMKFRSACPDCNFDHKKKELG